GYLLKYGIIGAMEEEIDIILQQMNDYQKYVVANCMFYKGNIENQEVILLQSGIGKVNAAMGTTILIERFQPDVVINTGSAGGFDKAFDVDDVDIRLVVVHHDVDVTGFDYQVGQVPGMPVTITTNTQRINKIAAILNDMKVNSKTGLIGTGDVFINNPD